MVAKNNSSLSQEKLSSISAEVIIKASTSAMSIIDQNGLILSVNKEFKSLFPLADTGADFTSIIETNELRSQLSLFLNNNEKSLSVEIDNSKFQRYTLNISFLQNDDCNNIYLLCAKPKYNFENIFFIQQLIDSIPDNIFIKDEQSRFILANNWVAKVMGTKTPEDLIGKSDFDFYPKPHAEGYFKDEQKIIKTGIPIINKQEQVYSNGKTKWYSTTKLPLHNKTGQIIGIMGIGKDITKLIAKKQKLEKALKEAEKADQLKSAFLANLSHEIRTPLNGILGFSQFLRQKKHAPEKENKYLDLIYINGKQLLFLMNDIIDISMIDSNQISIKKQPFNLNVLLQQIETNFKHQLTEKKPDLEIVCCPGLRDSDSLLYSDENRIYQIIGNLLNNAVKFSKEGQIDFGYTQKNNEIEFYVKDTGIGIASKHLKDIFLRFRQADDSITRKYGGTGLGLSICKGLVEKLGGKIWVNSSPKKGSVFYFTIPHITSENKSPIK